MFEFRYSTFFKMLLLTVCAFGGCDYLARLDKLKGELADLNSEAGPVHEEAESRRLEWEEIKETKGRLDALVKHEADLVKQHEMLLQKERRLSAEISYESSSMTAVVEKVRAAAAGTMITELRLSGRSSLHNAKILKVHEDSIAFMHEDGVAGLRASAEELPPNFAQDYDLGANSISQMLQKLLKESSTNVSK